ncbi:hypothetical protein MMC27_008031 [Xylographa pallens]|nr:hypothetical protein [Xylographa pallens]
MSQVPLAAPVSALASEKSATSLPKLRSCVVCRSRKVRCDKLSPCSNCRRGNIACVFPSADRPPRWPHRLERVSSTTVALNSTEALQEGAPDVGKLTERLRTLENLVNELSGQLKQANAAAPSTAGGLSGINSPKSSPHDRDADHQMNISSAENITEVQKQLGRMVPHDADRNRYVSSGFWAKVNDEIDGLKMDASELAGAESYTSEDDDFPQKTPSAQELEWISSKRHAFLFRHNLNAANPDMRDYYPLPSQIPFLLIVFSENVNRFFGIVHIPTVSKMVRSSDMNSLTPANEALLFSIYYAAVTSMEEADIMTDFGCTKADLDLKYRLGLEHALVKANFLEIPDIVLVQAFTIFLFLVRRHDSPKFVWMMTGLLIRMAHALGLHRDGSHFDHLTPYEVEIRRRVWWSVCILDVQASEDQGMELTITRGSFDTKLPLNINDTDIEPETEQTPMERQCLTDMTFLVVTSEICDIVQRLMAPAIREAKTGSEDQHHLLNEIYERLNRSYLQYLTGAENIVYWFMVICTRLTVAKMTLILYLPILFAPSSKHLIDEMRTKLLVSAIEVAEYNHTLNSAESCRQWRWIFQSCGHWHAIVYLLIEIGRCPWSPLVERAWVALHSSWATPVRLKADKNHQMWVPLRKLMAKARKHRDAELDRLRSDATAAVQLEIDDGKIPLPASSGPLPDGKSGDLFRERWRKLVAIPEEDRPGTYSQVTPAIAANDPLIVVQAVSTTQQGSDSAPIYGKRELWSELSFEPAYLASQDLSNMNAPQISVMATNSYGEEPLVQTEVSSLDALPVDSSDWSGGGSVGSGVMPWLWSDVDPSVDLSTDMDVNIDMDTEIDWYSWVDSARDMEVELGGSWGQS